MKELLSHLLICVSFCEINTSAKKKMVSLLPLPGVSGYFGGNVIVMSKDVTSLFSNVS